MTSQEALSRVRVFSDAVRAFSMQQSGDVQALLDEIARRVADVIGEFCGIGLVSDDGKWIHRVANYHRDADTLAFIRKVLGAAPLRTDAPHVSTRVLQTQQAVLIADADPDAVLKTLEPALHGEFRDLHMRSIALAPMRVRGRVVGL